MTIEPSYSILGTNEEKAMSNCFYHWCLEEFALHGGLPIYVESVAKGKHPERYFHDHDCSEIVFVLNGSAIHLVKTSNIEPCRTNQSTGLTSLRIQTGDVLVLHPSVIHAYDRTGDLEIMNIVYDRRQLALPMLDGYMLPLFRNFFPQLETGGSNNTVEPVITLSGEELRQLMPLLLRLKSALDNIQPGSLFESLTLFMEIIISISRLRVEKILPGKQIKFMIGKAIRFINCNYAREITLDQMANAAHMSRRNFCRHFRNMVGHSPVTYLSELRLSRAAELLVTTDHSISEISEFCGFADSNYFCRRFKEAEGITPRTFRNRSRNSLTTRTTNSIPT
ncbi:MAG: AraC family transcriptional regulator [Bacteroidia bacterium]|nr:AraC family transcriptional regulator [Bacteroidia bacterium]